ncbi:NAD(P)/FAD-dependent oxidoreductase [Streptomyces physcomitrii]|uniref:FAD-dependent oxidoreductase n=1 Tax=Streptomyces physcomitrii TaxID=2724184 RepID=A0ABX1H047_9ACTN|nr:FAD-dependent oxidoreductase [Streptomyces physcomitrii]NKI41727.1 FAD-dependent oxidoreductase [Streptomyces physcomitrii]
MTASSDQTRARREPGPRPGGTGRPRTAVIGSGIAGLSAAYVLSRSHDVTLYEADDRLGGHAHTHEVTARDGRAHRVDSGFIVHNRRTYPHFLRLLGELGVATQESEMSMSVRCEGCGLEYAGARGPRGLFAQPRSLGNPRFLRMLAEVPRFHRAARRLLADRSTAGPDGADAGPTLGEFLEQGGFSAYFTAHFATPLVSCVWSCDTATARRYPARFLFTFLEHHGMLSVGDSPTWRTITGGSREYVDRIAKQLGSVRTSTPVRAVHRHADGVEVDTAGGERAAYDSAVIATHPDQALRLLAEPTEEERRVLGALPYTANSTLLHTDASQLPRAPGARASWNYLLPDCTAGSDRVRVSYDMTRLQQLDTEETYVVTLGGDELVDQERVLARMSYEHPVHTPESVAARDELPALGGRSLAFAGAYDGWGFHEDGCRSGVAAARRLGVEW